VEGHKRPAARWYRVRPRRCCLSGRRLLNSLRLFFPALQQGPNNPLSGCGERTAIGVFAIVAILAVDPGRNWQRRFMLYRFERYLGAATSAWWSPASCSACSPSDRSRDAHLLGVVCTCPAPQHIGL